MHISTRSFILMADDVRKGERSEVYAISSSSSGGRVLGEGIFTGRFRDGEVSRECRCSAVNSFEVVWYRCAGNVNANDCHPHMSERVKGVEDRSDYERLVDEDVPSKILRSKEGDRCTNEGANGYLASGSVYLNVMRMQFRGWGTSTQLSV